LKKKIRKIFYSGAILALLLAGALYYAWQHTYDLPESTIARIRDYTKNFHNIDFTAEALQLNLPQHQIVARGLKIELPGEKSFAVADDVKVFLASGTGPLDLYYNQIAIERIEINGLSIDFTAPFPARDKRESALPDIPASQILINGLKINTSVTALNVPDMRIAYARSDRAASVDLSFASGPLGGMGKLTGLLDLGSGDANLRFSWQQKDFSGFLPLIYLWHLYGLNIVSGNAEIDLSWQGNLFARINNPRDNLARLFNKELDGRVAVNACQFILGKTKATLDLSAARTASSPWNLSVRADDGSGTLSLDAEYKGREDSLTDFVANLSGQRVVLPEAVLAMLGVTLKNTVVGPADFSGDFSGDIARISGSGHAAIKDWKYQDKNIRHATVNWRLNEDLRFFVEGDLNTEIGNLQASASIFLGGAKKSQGEITGDLDQVVLQSLSPFIESPVAGRCSGPFKISFDLTDPEKTSYDLNLIMHEGKFYSFEPEELTVRIFGTGAAWNLSNPHAVFANGGDIKVEGLINASNIAAKVDVKNVDLQTFEISPKIASGCAFLQAEVNGSLQTPEVRGQLWGQNVDIMQISCNAVRAQLLFKDSLLTLAPLVLSLPDDSTLDGYLNLSLLDGKLKGFKLNFQKFDVSQLRGLLPDSVEDAELSGVIAGTVSYDGTRGPDYWDFVVDGRRLHFDGNDIESLYYEGSIFGKQSEIRSLFVRALGGTLSVSGQVSGSERFSGTLEGDSLRFANIPAMRKFLPDLKGDLSFQGDVEWSAEKKVGNFTMFARDLKTSERDLGNFGGEVVIDDAGLRVNSGEFDKLGISIDGEIDWAGKRPYKAELLLDNVDFSFVPESHGIKTFDYGGLLVSGACSLQGDLQTGLPDAVNMQLESIRIQKENDIIVSNRPMQIVYQNGGIEIRSLELKYRLGILGVEGVVVPGKSLALMVNGKDFSIKALGRLFDLPNWNYEGNLSLSARLFGDLHDLKLKADAGISELVIAGRSIPEVRGRVEGDKSRIIVEDAHITLPNSSFNLKGNIDLAEGYKPININMHLSVPHGPLTDLVDYLPEVFREASGTIVADLNLTGRPTNPQIAGDLHLKADTLAFSNMRKPLTKVDFALSTQDMVINIDTLEAHLGRGKLSGRGQVDFRNSLGSVSAHLSGEKLDLSFMNLEVNGASASIDIGGDLYNPIITGKVLVPRGKFNLSTEIFTRRRKLDLFFDSLAYRFDIEVPRNFWVRSSFLNAEMRGKFSISGDLDDVKIDGGVSCVQGNLFFQQRRFRIDTGEIKFGGVENSFDPHIYVKSEGQIQSTKIFLTLQGRVSSFTPRIYSSPPMSESDLLAMLALGRDMSAVTHGDSKELFETEILEGLKNSYLSALIGNTISSALNLDELFLSSLFDRSSGKTKSFIRVGKYIGNNIFMAYEGTMDQAEEETYIFEYRLPKGFVVNIEFKEPVREQRINVRYDWKFW
jgi:autotransporter translocation and assembly factor TamB